MLNIMYLLEASTKAASNAGKTTDAMDQMTKPIITFLNSALSPLIALVAALGAVYCVFLGVKLAKAEEPQEREKAKTHLKNAVIGFLLIFILIVALRVGVGPLTTWVSSFAASTN